MLCHAILRFFNSEHVLAFPSPSPLSLSQTPLLRLPSPQRLLSPSPVSPSSYPSLTTTPPKLPPPPPPNPPSLVPPPQAPSQAQTHTPPSFSPQHSSVARHSQSASLAAGPMCLGRGQCRRGRL